MALAVMVVSLSYLLPLAVATGARPRADYCDGYEDTCLLKSRSVRLSVGHFSLCLSDSVVCFPSILFNAI